MSYHHSRQKSPLRVVSIPLLLALSVLLTVIPLASALSTVTFYSDPLCQNVVGVGGGWGVPGLCKRASSAHPWAKITCKDNQSPWAVNVYTTSDKCTGTPDLEKSFSGSNADACVPMPSAAAKVSVWCRVSCNAEVTPQIETNSLSSDANDSAKPWRIATTIGMGIIAAWIMKMQL